jgi:hypothetical protein
LKVVNFLLTGREAGRWAVGQVDRQAERQIDRQTGERMERMDRWAKDRKTDGPMGGLKGWTN